MKFKVSILIMLISLITIAGNAQTSTTTSTMHYTTVMSCTSTSAYGTTYRGNNSRIPMAPKIAAVATVATIGIYGLATKTRVSPLVVAPTLRNGIWVHGDAVINVLKSGLCQLLTVYVFLNGEPLIDLGKKAY
jgi:hypothetical protein